MTKNLFIAAGIFHPEPGGPATYLYEILPALQARGWQPRVLTYGSSTAGHYPYPLKRIPRRKLPLRLLHYRWASRVEVAQADLIYAHTAFLPLPPNKKPKLIKIVGDQAWERCIRRGWIAPVEDIDAFQQQSYSALVNWQKKARARQVRAFDGVIVPGEYLKRMVMGWGVPEEKVHVIYNAMPPPQKLPANQKAARAQLGWDERPVILTAARLTPWKGIDHLIMALHQVPAVRLIIAGDGPELRRLQILAQPLADRVQFAGRIPRADLYLMMQGADYFALYSGYEGLPHTVLEALRVGTPVIASDKGGNPEVVRHAVNGLLVPYGDADALAAALQYAFQAGKRQQLAANTQADMQRFTFARMVEQTDAILRRYLNTFD